MDIIALHDFLVRAYRSAGNDGDWHGHGHERSLWAYADAITMDLLLAIKKRREIERLVANLTPGRIEYLAYIFLKHSKPAEALSWIDKAIALSSECKYLGKRYSSKLILLRQSYVGRR